MAFHLKSGKQSSLSEFRWQLLALTFRQHRRAKRMETALSPWQNEAWPSVLFGQAIAKMPPAFVDTKLEKSRAGDKDSLRSAGVGDS